MGDRANIRLKDSESGVMYFYSHWGGSELPLTLKSALVRGKDRWDDSPYLSRIIFCEMIKDDVLDNTGFGLSTYETDNEHTIIEVDTEKNTVSIGGRTWTFDEYISDFSETDIMSAYEEN